jgi:hypothetical protein
MIRKNSFGSNDIDPSFFATPRLRSKRRITLRESADEPTPAFLFGNSATMALVVIRRPATEAAPSIVAPTILVGYCGLFCGALICATRIYKSINCCMSTSRCGISAYENTMQHLLTDPTLEAALPVIGQGGDPACAIRVSPMMTRPGGRNRLA